MPRKLLYLFLSIIFLVNCKSETTPKRDPAIQAQLDSIETANNQSIVDAGKNITKAYVNKESEEFEIWADMRNDHRFYGYEKPDSKSKRLILFSIFTSDVDGNPFELHLGSYYDTNGMEDNSVSYLGVEGDFVKTEFEDAEDNATIVYFEKKWIQFQDETNIDDDYNPDVAEDAIRDYGLIEKYEDGAYPMYVVTIDFVERNFKQDFDLNIESVSIDSQMLPSLVGKYATIYYTSDWVEDMNDLYFEGKSLSGQYAPELDENWSVIKGTLSGAKGLSGDLPSIITITNSANESMSFEWYVDAEVMKADGKEVTAYYSGRAINTIVSIEPSEN